MKNEELLEALSSVANFLRGMCFDPRLHPEIKRAITERVAEVDEVVESHLEE